MINGRTYYDILGLDKYGVRENGEKVSQESIQRRYYALKYGNNGEDRLPYWLLGPVEEAYRVLSDINLRKEYDTKLENGEFTVSAPAQEAPVQEAPAQEAPAQEAPAQEAPAQEAPAQEAPAQEVQEQEAPVQEVQEQEAQEQEVQEQEAQEQEAQEQEVQEQEVQEQEAQEQEAQEQEVQEQEAQEQETPESEKQNDKKTELTEEEKKQMERIKEISKIKEANRKQRTSNALIIAGSTLFMGPVGGIVAAVILKKKGKFKLQKVESKGIIKDIKTKESEFIAEENKKLEKAIDNLLNSSLGNTQNSYELEIAKLRYQNQIDLLQKRIDYQKSQVDSLGNKASNRLHLLALELRLKAAIKSLELKQKSANFKMSTLNSYNPSMEREDELSKLNGEIEKVKDELNQEGLSLSQKNRKTIKLKKLNQRKVELINKMSLKKNGIARKQLRIAFINSRKNQTSSMPVVEQAEEQQEENVRTR